MYFKGAGKDEKCADNSYQVESTKTCLMNEADGLGWPNTSGLRPVLFIINMLDSSQIRGTCILTLKFSCLQILEKSQRD